MGQKQRQMHGRRGGPGMGGPADRSKDFKGAWMNLLRYCKKEWPVIGFALGCAMVGTILTLIGPDRLSDLTDLIQDGIMTGIDLHAIAKIGILLAILYAISAILSTIQGWIMATVTQRQGCADPGRYPHLCLCRLGGCLGGRQAVRAGCRGPFCPCGRLPAGLFLRRWSAVGQPAV